MCPNRGVDNLLIWGQNKSSRVFCWKRGRVCLKVSLRFLDVVQLSSQKFKWLNVFDMAFRKIPNSRIVRWYQHCLRQNQIFCSKCRRERLSSGKHLTRLLPPVSHGVTSNLRTISLATPIPLLKWACVWPKFLWCCVFWDSLIWWEISFWWV